MAFEITTLEGDTELVDEANAYQLEGPFTTFFVADGGHGKISNWSQRVASLRTDRIASIRRVESELAQLTLDGNGAIGSTELLGLRAV